jgi:arabinogalactan endo-1,4-beta-galactosidase
VAAQALEYGLGQEGHDALRIVFTQCAAFVFSDSLEAGFRQTARAKMTDALSILGADVSSLQRAQDLGAEYYDDDGSRRDPLLILIDHGVNAIRLRVWVDPVHGYNNKERVAEFAARAKAKELLLLIDFHYSDTWADPGHQTKPAGWANHSLSQLQADVYGHTLEVCEHLKSRGATPNMVQIGNEINHGMLWPEGDIADWGRLAALLIQGREAAKGCSASIDVMLHIANAGDGDGARKWFENARSHGVDWDVIGLSYYSYWHGAMAAITNTVSNLKTHFGKPVVIAETAYPFTLGENDDEQNLIHDPGQLTPGYPATAVGQGDNLRDVLAAANSGGAAGVFYWEPTWTALKGNGWDPTNPESGNQWENQALFDFGNRALPALSAFKPWSQGRPTAA